MKDLDAERNKTSDEYLLALISKRDVLRKKEAELTRGIQRERSRLARNKKTNVGGVRYEEYVRVVNENKRLRGLIALLDTASGSTFEEIGKRLGVGTHRAREIVYQEIDLLKFYPPKV